MKKQRKTEKNPVTAYGAGRAFSFSMVFILCAYVLYAAVTALLENGGAQDYKSSALYVLFGFIPISLALLIGVMVSKKSEGFALGDLTSFKLDKVFILVIVLVWLGSFFGLSGVNNGFIELLKKLGYVPSDGVLPQKGFWEILGGAVFICAVPSVVEELLFRGIMLKGLKNLGAKTAVFLSALAFSLYHMSPDKTVYQFIIGALYAVIALKSGSVLPTVILHFLNNLTVLMNYYFLGLDLNFDSGWVFYLVTALGLLALVGGMALTFLHSKNDGEKSDKGSKKSVDKEENSLKIFLLSSAPGFLVCIAMWIANLFA